MINLCKNRIPNERKVLKKIYETYETSYPSNGDPYLEIDLELLAIKLKCKKELLFGYIYYHLSEKYRLKKENVTIELFTINFHGKKHVINFPYLSAILAQLDLENHWKSKAFIISVLSLAVSVASFFH